MYAGGGYDGTTTYFDFAEYVPSVDGWVIRANYPGYGTRGAKGVSLNGKGYVVGGTLNSSTPYSNQMWEYDPNTDTWTRQANIPLGATSGASFFGTDSLLYITHGHTGSSMHGALWAYNPNTNTWSQKTSFPGQPRLNAASINVGEDIIVGGGHQLVTGNVLNDYYAYNPNQDTWTPMPSFSGARRSSSAYFTIGNIGYLVGGFDSSSASLNSVWSFKPLITSTKNQKISEVNWTIFPSPAKNNFTLNLENETQAIYTIYSITGEIMMRKNLNRKDSQIDCSALAEGTYLIQVLTNGFSSTKKLIINR